MADTNPAIQAYQTQVQDYQQQVNDLKSDLAMQQTQLNTLQASYASLSTQLKSAAAGSPEQAEILAKRNALSATISDQEAKIADTTSALATKEQSLAQSQADLARVTDGGTAAAPNAPAVTGNADPQVSQASNTTPSVAPNTNTVDPTTDPNAQRFAQLGNEDTTVPVDAAPADVPVERQGDVLVDLNTGQEYPIDSNSGFVEIGGVYTAPEDIPVDRQGDVLVDANTGQEYAIDPDTGYVDVGGVYTAPEDLAQSPYEEEGTVLEFGANGEGDQYKTAAQIQAEADTLAQAQALQQLRAKSTNEDWRLRIRLAPNAQYLYKATAAGILEPLKSTNGVVFPYTPQISTSYRANYDAYDLVHTNYKGYFYKNSAVQEITINAVFTANNNTEADYLLAVIHFFRSASKMFYGMDSNPTAGTPPPVLYMDGLGVYQFNEHPCLLSSFDYRLPADVDYVRTGGARQYSGSSVNLASIRNQQGASSSTPLAATLSRLSSLKNAFDNFINPGARANNPQAQNVTNYYGITGQPTYVPTKIDISLVLLPLVSRAQQAQEFSLKNYATGQGLREQGFY